ncbi:MAG: hypothetical protein CMI27_01180 [Opitutae bacterium]|nr:hypothetical protein [Opitutae bacterium]|tara:strand:+ start:3026 stop:4663 length:1638 start_codon:yes stop_codon:yes gene_type:complete
MLSSGTRIGPTRIVSWLGEGSCGQSYHCTQSEGEQKGSDVYVKLIPRDLSEKKGFGDYFLQECQALEQLNGPGIWPLKKFGVMKWKHWIKFSWVDGKVIEKEVPSEESPGEMVKQEFTIRSLADLMEHQPEEIDPDKLLQLMTCLHQGLHRAHLSGVVHGNLKPRNILLEFNNSGSLKAWATEFGLWKMSSFRNIGEEETIDSGTPINLEAQHSHEEGAKFRPTTNSSGDTPEEKSDIYGLGKIVHWVIEKNNSKGPEWTEWNTWANQASALSFPSVGHSMEAMPGIDDLSQYGIKIEREGEEGQSDAEEIRIKREQEWALAKQLETLRFRRNMTSLIGGISFLLSLFSTIYLYLYPSPWTEYSLEGLLDSYQLGAGMMSGQAWGIVPRAYDDEGKGGQNVVGEWTREDGFFKLSFKKFKRNLNEEGDKKLWQFIGQGKTTDDDYYIWHDYLSYEKDLETLLLIRRVDEHHIYEPGKEGEGFPRLYPRERINSSAGKIRRAELPFKREGSSKVKWTLFFGVGFLLASSIYHRELGRLESEHNRND